MRRRLLAIAQDRKTGCIDPRESVCSNRAGRGGTDRGDFARMHDAHRLPRFRLE
jgi:hypothetical protein